MRATCEYFEDMLLLIGDKGTRGSPRKFRSYISSSFSAPFPLSTQQVRGKFGHMQDSDLAGNQGFGLQPQTARVSDVYRSWAIRRVYHNPSDRAGLCLPAQLSPGQANPAAWVSSAATRSTPSKQRITKVCMVHEVST